ncbi:MAG: hypothetical protein NZ879_02880 [Archaeoglobaceae archaeon]|nr:hypothetical protein [Archaeoglobaceae archaeon]MDW8117910.1 hypothetical protein [Archaeoglobaceae archaeon]
MFGLKVEVGEVISKFRKQIAGILGAKEIGRSSAIGKLRTLYDLLATLKTKQLLWIGILQ